MLTKIPNFLLYMIFGSLGSKLKSVTGYDVMDVNLEESVKKVTIPVIFHVTKNDTISKPEDVEYLYNNISCKHLLMQSKKQRSDHHGR